ncbi:hypothetical protein HMPREF1861_02078 [Corynebacterium kroppenstedtii]|nr:hypothetical protein HMPREF1861_02078 [Corynebacterium kroppenstedtii]
MTTGFLPQFARIFPQFTIKRPSVGAVFHRYCEIRQIKISQG